MTDPSDFPKYPVRRDPTPPPWQRPIPPKQPPRPARYWVHAVPLAVTVAVFWLTGAAFSRGLARAEMAPGGYAGAGPVAVIDGFEMFFSTIAPAGALIFIAYRLVLPPRDPSSRKVLTVFMVIFICIGACASPALGVIPGLLSRPS